jgi:hypothetical protein
MARLTSVAILTLALACSSAAAARGGVRVPLPSRSQGGRLVLEQPRVGVGTLRLSPARFEPVLLPSLGVCLAPGMKAAKAPRALHPQRLRAAPGLLPIHQVACLQPVLDQQCTHEEHPLAHAALCAEPQAHAPEPVIVDCRDLSIEWVQELVGTCDLPAYPGVPELASRDHSRDVACLELESCGTPPAPIAAASAAFQMQPLAIAQDFRVATASHGARVVVRALLRLDPGHVPRVERPPDLDA